MERGDYNREARGSVNIDKMGVAKLACEGNQLSWQDKQGKASSRVDVGYSKKRKYGWHTSEHMGNVRNSETCEPDV